MIWFTVLGVSPETKILLALIKRRNNHFTLSNFLNSIKAGRQAGYVIMNSYIKRGVIVPTGNDPCQKYKFNLKNKSNLTLIKLYEQLSGDVEP